MKFTNLTRSVAVILLTLTVAIFTGCSKKKERVYELLPPDPPMEQDRTDANVGLTVSIENTGGPDATEGSKRVIDNDVTTKFLTFSFDTTFYIQLEFYPAERLDAYTLTSANDSPDRDPKNWKIEGSNDLKAWTILDTQTNQAFDARQKTVRYEYTNKNTYRYYRLAISALNGGTDPGLLFQMAEWRMITRPE